MNRKNKIILFALTASILLTVVLLWKYLSKVAGLLVISAIEAYLFLPFVKILERKIKRTFSILICIISFLALNGAWIYFLAPVFVKQAERLLGVVPEYYGILSEKLNVFYEKIPELKSVTEEIDIVGNVTGKAGEILSKVSPSKIVSFFSTSLLVPVIMFYFLRDREKICSTLMFAVPVKLRSLISHTVKDINHQLRDYVYGEFIIVVAVSTVMASVLGLFQFDYWLILGILMGIFNIIPYIGPVLGSIPIILVASAYGLKKILLAIVLIVIVQQIDNLIIQPHIISESVKIHPVVVLVCVLIGNSVGNIFGMILAVPSFIVIRILTKELYKAFSERNCKFKQNIKNTVL